MERTLQRKQTVQILADSLKDLMERIPLRKITVQDITENCSLNRHTFYYHFKDIYDLLDWIYTNEFLAVINSAGTKDWRTVMHLAIRYAEENKALVKNVGCSLPEDVLKKTMYPFMKYWVSLLFAGCCHKYVEQCDKNFLLGFFTDAFTDSAVRWIKGGMQEDGEYILKEADMLQKMMAGT